MPRGIGYLLLCLVVLFILDIGFNLLLLVLLLILIGISILPLAGVVYFFFHLYVFGRVVLRNLWREVYRCPIWRWFRCVVVDQLINCHRWPIVFFLDWSGLHFQSVFDLINFNLVELIILIHILNLNVSTFFLRTNAKSLRQIVAERDDGLSGIDIVESPISLVPLHSVSNKLAAR